MLLCPDLADAADAAGAVGDAIAALTSPFTVAGHEVSILARVGTILARVGIAAAPHDGDHGNDLLRAANTALVQVRAEAGSGYRFCTAELAARSQRRFALKHGLHHALASLSFLKSFRFDRIKVDQSFMHDIAHDATNRAIAAAVLALSRELNIPVVAEGVETQEQVEFLREHSADAGPGAFEVQGFLFSRPLPGNECTRLLRERRRLN